ncbi:MAG TPA: choice-of-anchor D domain-containing protein [Pirellulales bacterium]|nr:choice-of-anchor D domain-containing protein [Pirellulales bacterium]
MARVQQLEVRDLLTASMQVFDGPAQIYNGGSDSFSSANVGDVATKDFTVEDTGDEDLSIGSINLPVGFSLQTPLPLDIPAGTSSTFTVSMDTSSANYYDGTMEIDSNDPTSPFDIDLSGTVNASATPTLDLFDGMSQIYNGGSDSFDTANVGDVATKTFTIDEGGGADLNINSISLPAGFSLQTSLPIDVPAYGSGTFTVSMDTSSANYYDGTMEIDSNDPTSPFDIDLSGTVNAAGQAPAMSLLDGSTTIANGGSDSFGTAAQGTSDSKTFTVDNTGNASLSISAISPPTGFSLGTTLPLSIAAGGSGTFVVSMDTSTAATLSGTMSITDNDSNNDPYDVSLSGTVTAAPEPAMSLLDGSTAIANGGSDSFGSVVHGGSDTKTFTVDNTGTASLSVSAIGLPTGYSLQTALPLTIAAGSSATFVVALDTSAVGTLAGPMSITDSDGNNDPYTVNLSGTVTPALHVWVGGGADNHWTTAANWQNDQLPLSGDDLLFQGTSQLLTQDDFAAGTSFDAITFGSNGFSLTGNTFTVTSGVTVDSGVTGSLIAANAILGGPVSINIADASLSVSGIVSGSGSLGRSAPELSRLQAAIRTRAE